MLRSLRIKNFKGWKDTGHIEMAPIIFKEFPDHEGLQQFDLSDRKFVAAANAHEKKPPIAQATDSKWWGWKNALEEAGLSVFFVHEEYIRDHAKQVALRIRYG